MEFCDVEKEGIQCFNQFMLLFLKALEKFSLQYAVFVFRANGFDEIT